MKEFEYDIVSLKIFISYDLEDIALKRKMEVTKEDIKRLKEINEEIREMRDKYVFLRFKKKEN